MFQVLFWTYCAEEASETFRWKFQEAIKINKYNEAKTVTPVFLLPYLLASKFSSLSFPCQTSFLGRRKRILKDLISWDIEVKSWELIFGRKMTRWWQVCVRATGGSFLCP